MFAFGIWYKLRFHFHLLYGTSMFCIAFYLALLSTCDKIRVVKEVAVEMENNAKSYYDYCDGGPAAHTHTAHHSPRVTAGCFGQHEHTWLLRRGSRNTQGWQRMTGAASPHLLREEEQL